VARVVALVLRRGQALGRGRLSGRLAAILGERDLLRGVEHADRARRLATFDAPRNEPALDRGALQRARRLVEQWQKLLARFPVVQPLPSPQGAHWSVLLLALV